MRRLFVLLVLPNLVGAAPARAEIIERVIAKVNGEIITLSEFQSRQIAAAQAARVDPSQVGVFLRQSNARILQEAIDEILLLQRATDAGLKIPPQFIDDAIASIKKENNITSDEQMQEALRREGLTLEELRRNIERSMTRQMITRRDIEPKITVAEAELVAEYEARKGSDFTKKATVTLQEILVAEEAGGLVLARQIVERARVGEDFASLAKTFSSAPSRASGGDIGEIAQGDLNPDLEQVAFTLPVGAVSDPVSVGGGYRVLKVVAKTAGSVVPFDTAKDQIRDRLMMARFEKEYEIYMQDIRKNASVELRVREVPLQLTGPVPEGGIMEGLDPFTFAPSAPARAPAPASPPEATVGPASPPPSTTDEVSTTPQARPERVAPPPPASAPPKPQEPAGPPPR